MAREKELVDVIEKIQHDASGFIAASLVDLDSGMTLAVKAVRSDFDLTAASAYNSELVKQKLKIMATLGIGGTIEDMLITLSDQIHLIKMVSKTTFLYLAVDRSQSNLAIVRTAVAKHAAALAA
jgi:predicted regulator of Ras-like GTPase activity (Roadblock/LC7/MglB family)